MLRTQLSSEQRAELEALRRHAVGRVAGRAQMVLLNNQGFRDVEIAQIAGCGCPSMPPMSTIRSSAFGG